MKKSVLGIGNALVDILIKLNDESVLNNFSLPKGSMQLVSADFADKIDEQTKEFTKHQASGGSASNTMHGLAGFGMTSGYIGKTGNDKLGRFFRKDLEDNNIHPHLYESENNTGRAMTLITPDSERTFATHLGAALDLSAEEMDENIFRDYNVIHLEGYLVQNQQLMNAVAKIAQKAQAKISLDLASFNIVEDNFDFLRNYIQQNVDIVFANEEEAKAYGKGNIEEGFYQLGTQTEIAIIKTGENGSVIHHQNELIEVPSISSHVIDTTGAGDLYASGFLYGYLNGYSLKKSGDIGSLMAGMVIELMGAKLDHHRWDEINTMLKHL